ncbi:MAG: helix-turn-helix domain-containing protein [Candidatus Thermoplasmatota archaeon]|nr:helix-turn-helix domain-containing protein [Candidatus Thermoplasmatota archaeon]
MGEILYEAVLSVNLSESWIGKTMRMLPVSISVLDSIPLDEKGVEDLVEVKLNSTSIDILESTVKDIKGVDFVKVSKVDLDKVIMIVGVQGCVGCRTIIESGCFLISANSTTDGWIEWKLIMNEKLQLQNLVSHLNDHGVDNRLILIQPVDDKESLTARQERIIKTALERGYYDFPKRIGIRELARLFNISTASVSETLRRGQKKIIEQYFKGKGEKLN